MIGRRSGGSTEKASKTILAASGSTAMFHSLVGVVLPMWLNEPPMMTRRLSSSGSSGSMRSASARLVSGPVTRPMTSPGRLRAVSAQTSVACLSESGVVGFRQFGVAHALGPVGGFRGLERLHERHLRAERHLDVARPAELQQGQVVPGHVPRGDVAGGAGDGEDLGLRAGEQVDQRERVVDAGVDIHDDGLFHKRASVRVGARGRC